MTLDHRLKEQWQAWEFHPGYSFDARIRIPASELREFETPNDRAATILRVIPEPPLRHAVEFGVMSGPAHHSGPAPNSTNGLASILREFRLASGRRVWIVAQDIPAPTAQALDEIREHIKADPSFQSARSMMPAPTAATRLIGSLRLPDGGGPWVELAYEAERSQANDPHSPTAAVRQTPSRSLRC